MGSLKQVDAMEEIIGEFGEEIKKLKTASEYIQLIEKMQLQVSTTSDTLMQSKDQIKMVQDIVESKLELFNTISRNLEAKQTNIEQAQHNLNDKISELSRANQTAHATLESKLNEQQTKLSSTYKFLQLSLGINAGLVIIFMLLVLFVK
ncbi:hypothetical protein [Paenibacillus sp. JDR-2]|uniref:hypothetical protein n=1 Tax=Paenibacillus sp. (strain JDR-2) TaxID=324057 RepID=UPI0001668C22|nr:hypothetical protein [Paenibacillus sp. JDR-2]ACT03357.1 hypothetical protein Pjdr2_4744 [Paenibacillus sp. JDR-2]